MPQPVRAAAYYRMSDDRQENSINRQRSQVIPYAKKHGYEITQEYTDEGIPGDQIARRREFQRMLRDAQAGRFEAILCDDKDRFGRFDAIDLGEVVAPLRRKGVWLETVAQGRIDWNTFAGRITDAILQEAKNLESDALSRRVLSSQLLKGQKGLTTGGRAAYGYRWESDREGFPRLVPDGHKAEVVKLIFRMYDQGHTLYAIAEELRKRAVRSPRGNPSWTRTVIKRVLTNRRYVGDWTWGVHPQGKRHRFAGGGLRPTARGERSPRRNPEETWQVIAGHHEALIDRDQFERVQARLLENRTLTVPHPEGGGFVLNRLLVCQHCGSFLSGLTQDGKRRYACRGYLAYGPSYCKRNQIAEKPLLDKILRELQRAFLDPDYLARLRQEAAAQEAAERSEDNLGRLRKRAEDLEAKLKKGNERLLTLPADRLPGVVEQMRSWERERAEALAELKRIARDSPVDRIEKAVAEAEAALWRLHELLEAEDFPLLRQLLHETIDRIELRWTHHTAKGKTRARFSEGWVRLRPNPASSKLFPSAAR
jgi:DNA invertase Pin-like site-specific DNA recombinase